MSSIESSDFQDSALSRANLKNLLGARAYSLFRRRCMRQDVPARIDSVALATAHIVPEAPKAPEAPKNTPAVVPDGMDGPRHGPISPIRPKIVKGRK
jgi:hypothetical protein